MIELLYTGGVPQRPQPAPGPQHGPGPLPTDLQPTDLPAFAVYLRRMNAEFNRIAQQFARAQGLHHTDVQALVAILDGDGDGEAMTPGRLSQQLDLTSGAVSACLNRLEAAGHIRRVRDSTDGRVVHLHYAPAGRRIGRAYFRPLAQVTDEVRGAFAEEELQIVARFLFSMGDALSRRHQED